MNLTKREKDALNAISKHITEQHCSPSSYDLAKLLQISQTRARQHMAALEAKGAIRRIPGKACSVSLV